MLTELTVDYIFRLIVVIDISNIVLVISEAVQLILFQILDLALT